MKSKLQNKKIIILLFSLAFFISCNDLEKNHYKIIKNNLEMKDHSSNLILPIRYEARLRDLGSKEVISKHSQIKKDTSYSLEIFSKIKKNQIYRFNFFTQEGIKENTLLPRIKRRGKGQFIRAVIGFFRNLINRANPQRGRNLSEEVIELLPRSSSSSSLASTTRDLVPPTSSSSRIPSGAKLVAGLTAAETALITSLGVSLANERSQSEPLEEEDSLNFDSINKVLKELDKLNENQAKEILENAQKEFDKKNQEVVERKEVGDSMTFEMTITGEGSGAALKDTPRAEPSIESSKEAMQIDDLQGAVEDEEENIQIELPAGFFNRPQAQVPVGLEEQEEGAIGAPEEEPNENHSFPNFDAFVESLDSLTPEQIQEILRQIQERISQEVPDRNNSPISDLDTSSDESRDDSDRFRIQLPSAFRSNPNN